MAPADSICISMKPGNTSAMPASASVPRCDTHQVSIRPVEACASITRMFGQASRSRVGRIGPCSSRRVRGLMVGRVGAMVDRGRRGCRDGRAHRTARGAPRAAGCRAPAGGCVASVAAGPAATMKSGAVSGRPVARSTSIGSAGLPVRLSTIRKLCALGREMPVAPGQQGDQHRREIGAARASAGTRPAAAARCSAVAPGARSRPAHSAAWSACAGAMPRLCWKSSNREMPGERVAQDQHAPPLADPLQAAGDRAGHALEALAAHSKLHQ